MLIDDEELVGFGEAAAGKVRVGSFLMWVLRLEALDIVSREQSVSLVVCDVRLGEEQGFEVVDTLQESGLHAPVLYITGYASRGSQGPR